MPKCKSTHLSPEQLAVKRPGRIIYEGEGMNCSPERARHIIELYLVGKLGYSPIRHILNEPHDHRIENVIRQHRLGRSKVNGNNGELECPGSSRLDLKTTRMIKEYSEYYGTSKDPYVVEMVNKGRWKDDPIKADDTKCNSCKFEFKDADYQFCPKCGKPRYKKGDK